MMLQLFLAHPRLSLLSIFLVAELGVLCYVLLYKSALPRWLLAAQAVIFVLVFLISGLFVVHIPF